MADPLKLQLDRTSKVPLSEQIRRDIATAIERGVLAPGARLPSWIDLAAQLGVARGTVRVAYEKLQDAQLIGASRAEGTRVAQRPSATEQREDIADPGAFMEAYLMLASGPSLFQMGIPAKDSFPAKLFTRIRTRSIRLETSGQPLYPDPRGEFELRREIAAYLAIARGIECSPNQVIVSAGYSGGLGLALRALGLEGRKAWMEDPGFHLTRHALELARLSLVHVPVDEEGLDVDKGLALAPDAALAVLTPGQQAPLGPALSLKRRLKLLEWAGHQQAWVIEDDYLSELQLQGRAAPALASLDHAGRVVHIGSFSKTINPKLRLGFVVAPPSLVSRFSEVAAVLAPAPGPAVQFAMAEFIREGHYMRHLRRTKRFYSLRRDALKTCLAQRGVGMEMAGLAALLKLADGVPDLAISREALSFGMGPAPLSQWYASPKTARSGLLLSVATTPTTGLDRACERLVEIIERLSSSPSTSSSQR